MIEWIDRNIELPEPEERVLTYSPCFEEMYTGHEMTYRLILGQFVRRSIDVTHWARITPPEENKE